MTAPELPPIAPPESRPGGLLGRADRVLSPLSSAALERAGIAGILVLGLIDYSLAPAVLFSVFYLLPIVVTAWYGEKRAGYFACGFAAAAAIATDILSRETQLPGWVDAWNTGVRLTTFLIVAALAVRLRQALTAQKKLALSDPLTGLANTRAFFDRVSAEIDRSLRYGTIFTLAYLDLDHFKEVNDNYGHAEGDDVLRKVAETMRSTMRATDMSARLGGDEFGIILPETPFGKAEGALGKLRTEVAAAMTQANRPVRISVGAVTFEASVETADDAMRLADDLMYEAKQAGGDTIRQLLWTGDPGRRPPSAARK